MAHSEAYSIIKALMEKSLLSIHHIELVGWLDRLEAKGQISKEESQDLLQLADQLKISDLPMSD